MTSHGVLLAQQTITKPEYQAIKSGDHTHSICHSGDAGLAGSEEAGSGWRALKEDRADLEAAMAADDRRMVTVHGIPVEYATVFPGGQVKHQLVYPGGGILPYINDQAMALRCALREIRIMVAGMLAELIAFQAPPG